MSIKNAKKVILELKKNGYEAYMVGGAVRDRLLKIPITDVDITTNARPYQVAKMFKTVPTGIKYGTVTVMYSDEQFEVTTYRIDGEYSDNRHPETVIYSDEVEQDVMRRDFTINGLLMDENEEIFDYVNGISDLKNKLIRTIGNPEDRFNEDALRLLRAFHFQSKLGFQIEEETFQAIKDFRNLIKEVSRERVLAEIIKILQGEDVLLAFQSLIDTKMIEMLPGLEKGVKHFLSINEKPYVDVFFTISFALHGFIPKEWNFSNKHRNRYEIAANLTRSKSDFDPITLYTYGLDHALLANRAMTMLKYSSNRKQEIEDAYKNLKIQSLLDLKLRAPEIIKIANKKAGAWVRELQEKMVIEILNNRLENKREALIDFIKKSLE